MKINDELIVDVKRLGINGEGIAYYLKLTIFIENALPDETVKIRITDVKEKYATAEILKFVQESKHRVKAFCKYYYKCGGCNLQHLDYASSLKYKRDMLMETISKYSGLNPRAFEVRPTVGMDNPKGYRNKSQMPVCTNKNELCYGLYESNSKKIVPIDFCLVQNETVNNVNIKVARVLEIFKISPFNEGEKNGILRNVVTRVSLNTSECQVTLVLTKDDKTIDLAAKEIIEIANVVSVYKSINPKSDDGQMFGDSVIKLEGKDTIIEKIGNFQFNLLPNSFFQLNPIQTEKLYDTIKKACKLSFKEKIIDAYCGVGTIGLYLAKNAAQVIGVEINKEAIINAEANARLNRVKNISFICGDATTEVPKLINDGFIPDIMVFDPPRTGMTKEIKDIICESSPKRIIYVSCNPASMAKDLKDLKNDYQVKSITPFDMFPFTAHIESVVLLEKK